MFQVHVTPTTVRTYSRICSHTYHHVRPPNGKRSSEWVIAGHNLRAPEIRTMTLSRPPNGNRSNWRPKMRRRACTNAWTSRRRSVSSTCPNWSDWTSGTTCTNEAIMTFAKFATARICIYYTSRYVWTTWFSLWNRNSLILLFINCCYIPNDLWLKYSMAGCNCTGNRTYSSKVIFSWSPKFWWNIPRESSFWVSCLGWVSRQSKNSNSSRVMNNRDNVYRYGMISGFFAWIENE